jgi:hypothetical protein
MASFIHRATYEYVTSVHSPDYPIEDWLKNPDLSGVVGVEQKFWKVVGDTVVEMSQAEKDVIIAVEDAAAQQALESRIIDNMVVPEPGTASPEVIALLEDHPIWTDSETGLSGPMNVIEPLSLRRELHGDLDTDNPVWIPNFDGVLVRTQNLETIHGKLGWHNQQIVESRYYRPCDMLIYYGWLSGFNAHGNNELVAQELARYGVLVFGSGLADPVHADYANTIGIIGRVKALKPSIQIFGYVQTPLVLGTFQSQVDNWVTLGVTGVFMDEAGYDYGVDRAGFNARVDYIHNTGLAVMANAWNQDNIVGVVEDPTYLNATYNPSLVPSSLNTNDWYLLESAPINTQAYSGTGGYQSRVDWSIRAVKAIGHRATFGLNTAACGIIDDANLDGQDLFDFGFVAALMFSLEAWGVSDESYGAITGKGKWWNRPDVSGMGIWSWLNPSVQSDLVSGQEDVYYRYSQFGRLSIDFSSGAQESTIVKL